MKMFLIISLFLCMISVAVVMVLGIFSLSKGGDFNVKYGNKLMQARVYLQGLALVLLALTYFASQG